MKKINLIIAMLAMIIICTINTQAQKNKMKALPGNTVTLETVVGKMIFVIDSASRKFGVLWHLEFPPSVKIKKYEYGNRSMGIIREVDDTARTSRFNVIHPSGHLFYGWFHLNHFYKTGVKLYTTEGILIRLIMKGSGNGRYLKVWVEH